CFVIALARLALHLPYSTLFRSLQVHGLHSIGVVGHRGGQDSAQDVLGLSALLGEVVTHGPPPTRAPGGGHGLAGRQGSGGPQRRSEEHTSELQSRENLVCRLML